MQRVLISGGAGTIGSAIVDRFVREGYHAVVLDLHEKEDTDSVEYHVCDVTDADALQRLAKSNSFDPRFNSIVTVAGGALPSEWGTFEETDVKAIRDSIDVNLMGQINVVHTFYPYMKDLPGSKSIVLTSSVNALAAYRIAGYSSSKAGLFGFMYSVAKEMGRHDVRINAVVPGTVVSELTLREKDKDWNALRAQTLLNRFAQPDDIAKAVWFLNDNTAIDAQSIVVDAGQLA